MTSSKTATQNNYDRLSRWYDLIASSERKYKQAGLEMLAVQKEETILEVGFGTGWGLLELAKSVGDAGHVSGVDISAGMYNVAEAKIARAGYSNRVDIRIGDAAELPYEANTFDGIFSSFTLELFSTPEIPVVLAECKRVLRPGGRLCVVSLNKKEQDSLMVRMYEWTHKAFPHVVDCRPIFIQQAIEDAGFKIADRAEMSMWGLPVLALVAGK
ncbi:class I SAM-dependent methyltransferase [Chloroflexota bacterium]